MAGVYSLRPPGNWKWLLYFVRYGRTGPNLAAWQYDQPIARFF
jgi:hypothetical protein